MSETETDLPKSPADPPASAKPGRWTGEELEQPWTIGEAIGVGMGAMRRHFFALTLPVFLMQLLALILGALPMIGLVRKWLTQAVLDWLHPQPTFSASSLTIQEPPPVTMLVIAGVLTLVIVLFFNAIGLSVLGESALAAVRDEKAPPGKVGRAIRRAPRLLVWEMLPFVVIGSIVAPVEIAMLAYGWQPPTVPWWLLAGAGLAMASGLVGYRLMFCWTPFFLVDDGVSLVQAMRKSWRASKRSLGTVFLYMLALAPIWLLVSLPFVGIIPLAFTYLGLAYGYARATGRNELPWYTPDFASGSIRAFLKILLVVLSLMAGGLIVLAKLPKTTSVWSIGDTLLHAVAIISTVAVVIVLMALLLPYGLDRLEGRRFTSFVAARHVRSQKSGFLTVISVLSICGVAISSCALSSVRGVMDGFGDDLKRKILGNTAHIVIDTADASSWGDYTPTVEAVRAVPGVVSATPVVHGEVMASSASNLAGVVVTGIDPNDINDELKKNIKVGKLAYLEHPEKLTRLPPEEVIGLGPNGEQYKKGAELPSLQDDLDPDVRAVLITKPDRPGIILGLELAKTLHVYVGDEVTLVSPLGDLGPMGIMPRTKRFRVAAIFDSGMYEYDAMSVYMMLEHAQDYFATGKNITAVDIRVADVEKSDRVLPAVIAAVNRPELRIRDWREINKNLFSALALERYATSIILSIAILVASFCIICTLLLMVTEKGKEIAILKAIGSSDGAVLRIFMIEGIIIGGIGMLFGVITGLALCSGLKWIGLPLPSEVYYIHGLPVRVSAGNFVAVAVAALLITTLSTVYPAYAASRLRPVDGLRYE